FYYGNQRHLSIVWFFFFFSSRRRHTRLQGDWSSDVCSSDLGMPALRSFLAQRLSSDTLTVKPDNILIVTGSQQALDLIARVFLNEHDRVILENPTYLGMLQTCKP